MIRAKGCGIFGGSTRPWVGVSVRRGGKVGGMRLGKEEDDRIRWVRALVLMYVNKVRLARWSMDNGCCSMHMPPCLLQMVRIHGMDYREIILERHTP